jgi:hypothetical protein
MLNFLRVLDKQFVMMKLVRDPAHPPAPNLYCQFNSEFSPVGIGNHLFSTHVSLASYAVLGPW